MSSGSKDMAVECGLGGRICRAGQRTCRRSVVCGEKTLRRSKKLSAECGLGGRTCRAGQEGRRWSVVCGEKTPSGSKDSSTECDLWRELAERVKGHVGGVWSRARNHCAGQRSKTPPQ